MEIENKKIKCAVCGINPNGSHDIFFCLIEGSRELYEEDAEHYNKAIAKAKSEDWEVDGSSIVIDEQDDGRAVLQLFNWESLNA